MQHHIINGGKIMENRCEIEILLENLKKRLKKNWKFRSELYFIQNNQIIN